MLSHTCHADPPGSPPMSFQLGALPHFRTRDQARFGEFVRILGLGGVTSFDWSADPRRARLTSVNDDYVTFDGGCEKSVWRAGCGRCVLCA